MQSGRSIRRKTYRKKKAFVRKNRRTRRYVKRSTTLGKQLVIGDRAFTKLRYINSDPAGEQYVPFTVAASYNYVLFRMNALNDPDPSFAANETPGFFDWGSFYQKFRVRACKIVVSWMNPDTVGYYCGMFARNYDDLLTPSYKSFRNSVANRYATSGYLTPISGSKSEITRKLYVPLAHLYGDRVTYMADPKNIGIAGGGGAATSPVNLFPVYIWVAGLTGAVGEKINVNIPISVKMTFYTEYFDRQGQYA